MSPGRLLGPSALLLATLLGAGCAKPSTPGDDGVRSSSDAIVNGSASPATQDGVVLLRFPAGSCSGSLVARNVVLTARHCVSELDETQENVRRDFRAADIQVFVGRDALQVAESGSPVAVGRRLFVTGKKMLPDVALLVLDRNVTRVPVLPIRLTGGAEVGEPLTIVGYGLTENSEAPDRRLQRTGKTVTSTFPQTSEDGSELGPGEFTFGEAACSGDSGGPALSARTGAVVGVASRVGNGEQPDEQDRANFCRGSNTINFYTALEPVRSLVEQAFAFAGASPTLEGGDEPEETTAPAEDEGATDPPPAAEEGTTEPDPESVEEEPGAREPAEEDEAEDEPTTPKPTTPKKRKPRASAGDESTSSVMALPSSGCHASSRATTSSGSVGLALGLALLAASRRARRC